jgi:hypothetical protein
MPTKKSAPATPARKNSPATSAKKSSSKASAPKRRPAATAKKAATVAAPDADLIYVNGIDPATGKYAVPPFSLENLAKRVRKDPGVDELKDVQGARPRAFAPPLGKDLEKLEDVGWAVVFHEDTPKKVRTALEPLLAHRRKQAGNLFKVLDYQKDEQARAWYVRHQIAPANIEPELVPYYVLLIGPPTDIPFEFQYLLGIEYAVGRLAFDKPVDYARYAQSVIEYETAKKLTNSREIVYWGTHHPGDRATDLSASFLIDPLANGVKEAPGALRKPLHQDVGYKSTLYAGDDATKANLLATLRGGKPPSLLFTASHGMAIAAGRPNQVTDQGGLLCQDWPGFGAVQAQHFCAATDVPATANVSGLVAFLFACFGAGTPDADQFLMNLANAGKAPPLAPEPFVAALPKRLLAHPKGGALGVIGHVDRAWGYSIQPPSMAGAQIGEFRNCLGNILLGAPVGHSLTQQFGQRYAVLSTELLNAVSPTAPALARLSDRDLVARWLERNDAQNYVLLGDPAARVRKDTLR